METMKRAKNGSAGTRVMMVLTALLSGPGCGAVGFDYAQDIPEQRVPASAVPVGGLLPSFLPVGVPITLDLKAQTAAHGTGPATAAYLTALSLSATPSGTPSGNFDFLSQVHIMVASKDGSLPTVEIATLDPVPQGQTTVKFVIIPNVDLLPYINVGASLTARASGSQPAKEFTYNGKLVISIRV